MRPLFYSSAGLLLLVCRFDELNLDYSCCTEQSLTCGPPNSHRPLTFLTAKVYLPAQVQASSTFSFFLSHSNPRRAAVLEAQGQQPLALQQPIKVAQLILHAPTKVWFNSK